jgi:hypothetical protein
VSSNDPRRAEIAEVGEEAMPLPADAKVTYLAGISSFYCWLHFTPWPKSSGRSSSLSCFRSCSNPRCVHALERIAEKRAYGSRGHRLAPCCATPRFVGGATMPTYRICTVGSDGSRRVGSRQNGPTSSTCGGADLGTTEARVARTVLPAAAQISPGALAR